MSRATGSRKFHERLYPIMQEAGALSTTEVFDILNNRIIDYRQGLHWKTRESYTKNQVAQILRTSHFFKQVGHRSEKNGSGGRSPIMVYECVPVEDVVKKIASYKHTAQDYKRTLPNFAREQYFAALEAKQNET